jgi:hypothetical protein
VASGIGLMLHCRSTQVGFEMLVQATAWHAAVDRSSRSHALHSHAYSMTEEGGWTLTFCAARGEGVGRSLRRRGDDAVVMMACHGGLCGG